MDIQSIKHAFIGSQSGGGIERHNLKNLSRRLMVPKKTARMMLESGELEFQTEFETGSGRNTSWSFSAGHLDKARRDVVDSLVAEIQQEMEGLDVSEQERVIATMTGLKAHQAACEHEFASKAADDDEDSDTGPLSKLGGAGIGATAGAVLGSRVLGAPGMVGGAALGGLSGYEIGSRQKPRDATAAAGLGIGAVVGARAIQKAGGVGAVAGQAADAIEGGIKRATKTGKTAIGALGTLKSVAQDKGVDLGDLWKAITKAGSLKAGAKAIAKGI